MTAYEKRLQNNKKSLLLSDFFVDIEIRSYYYEVTKRYNIVTLKRGELNGT